MIGGNELAGHMVEIDMTRSSKAKAFAAAITVAALAFTLGACGSPAREAVQSIAAESKPSIQPDGTKLLRSMAKLTGLNPNDSADLAAVRSLAVDYICGSWEKSTGPEMRTAVVSGLSKATSRPYELAEIGTLYGCMTKMFALDLPNWPKD
jgi:hypothetical protein